MRKNMIVAALLAAGLGAPALAAAQDYRLAFSKAENIEIFVEGATQDNWCAEALTLRAAYGGVPDEQALARLLPKLGALFAQQCPQASTATWHSVDSTGKRLGQGSSRAADGWQLVAAANKPAVTTTAEAVPPVAEATVPATPQAVSPVPDVVAESTSATSVATPSAPAASTQASAAAAPLAPPVEAALPGAPAPAQSQETQAAQAPAAPVVPAPAVAAPAAQAAAPKIGLVDFAVGGWQPPARAQRAEMASFMTTLQDQNGCKIVSAFDFGEQASYMTLQSENLSCGADGYAQGKGRLKLERSDGMQIARTGDLWFSHGLVFNKPVQGLSVADIVVEQDKQSLWFGLASDVASQSHYLLKATLGQFRGGIGVWQLAPQLDVLTAQPERFRQADAIRAAVDGALSVLQSTAMPDAADVRLFFADDAEGIVQRKQDNLLYAVNASRPFNYRSGKPQGDWRYNLQQGQNYLFQREARLAQQQRQEEERKERERQNQLRQQARVEQDNLRQYEELRQVVEQGSTDALRQRLERDIAYQPFGRDVYSRLMTGGQDKLSRIVRVDGSKAKDATVDWPYPMRLLNQESLKKGWYWISGERSLDPTQLDEDDLPISLVQVDSTQVQACQKEGCADLLDPLGIMRVQLGQPDWTPEAAQAVIDSAPKGFSW